MTRSCNHRLWGTVRTLLFGASAVMGAFADRAEGVVVDREILILVDVGKSVSDADFSAMMLGYAEAFESSSVIAAVENGDVGSIAASLVFYSDKKEQAVGVGWMEMSTLVEAETFADQLRGVGRPFNKNKTSIAEAMDFAVPLFGTETGGAGNGFESGEQMLLMAADGADDHSPKMNGNRDTTVADSRDAALADGVDVINALTVGAAGSVDAYFAQFVVGGSVDGVLGQVQNVEDFADFGGVVAMQIQAAVPEPHLGLVLLIGFGLLGMRRNRA